AATTQCQDADIGLLEGVEDAIIAAANAMQSAMHVFELFFDLRIGHRILCQVIDLFNHLVYLLWRQGQQRLIKVRFLGDAPFYGHFLLSLSNSSVPPYIASAVSK